MREALGEGHAGRGRAGRDRPSASSAGFEPDYAAVRRARTWPSRRRARREGLVALIAARLGGTRLIDNLLLD